MECDFNVTSDYATYETQYGHLRRPTHYNTSWDLMKFEVCGHRWADLSEHGFGVALLNDCKYGYSTYGQMMTLSLLRAPKWPDSTCDIGEHTFRYAIMPHGSTFQNARVIQQAMIFNSPLLVRQVDPRVLEVMEAQGSFLKLDTEGVIIDAVKKAHDYANTLIVRVYEAYGGRGQVTLEWYWHSLLA